MACLRSLDELHHVYTKSKLMLPQNCKLLTKLQLPTRDYRKNDSSLKRKEEGTLIWITNPELQ